MTDIEQKISERIRALSDEEQLEVLEFARNLLKEHEAETKKENELSDNARDPRFAREKS